MDQVNVNIKSFARNGWILKAMPVAAAVTLAFGISFLWIGDIGAAAMWLLLTVVWYLNYRWSSQTPFIVLSDAGIALRTTPLAPAKQIPWNTVMSAQLSGPSRLTLYLTSGRKFSIYLTWINAQDRRPLVKIVEHIVAEKGAAAQ